MPARCHPALRRRGHLPRCGQGQGRPDHRVLQRHRDLQGEGRRGTADRAARRRQGDQGSGTAAATVTAQLKDEGDATHVGITTDLAISGKAAQFGRGVLADVAGNLIAQFARSLEAELGAGTTTATPAASTTAPTAENATAAAQPAGDSVDLLKVVAVPMAKRFAPVIAAAAAAGAIGFLIGRRKRQAPAAVLADDLQAALARLLSS